MHSRPSRFFEQNLPSLRRAIRHWFARCGREFPWRREKNPYPVWVSEIMLQQTTTETVRGYFERFVARFPTPTALAQGDISEVLSLWEGLGYYRRAHQLHAAARQIAERYGGHFPSDAEAIRGLPGVGRYTAGAILSFAFDRRSPILEANTLRLHARLLGLRADLKSAASQKILWDFAEAILPKDGCGDFNQALLDLGSQLCRPTRPLCDQCPAARYCIAAKLNATDQIPWRTPPVEKESRTEVALLIPESIFLPRATGKKKKVPRYLFVAYPPPLRWAGLWDFPRFLADGEIPPSRDRRLLEKIKNLLGDENIELGAVQKRISHAVTRYKIELLLSPIQRPPKARCRRFEGIARGENTPVELAGGTTSGESIRWEWLTLDEAKEKALNSTGRRLLHFLNAQEQI